MEFGKLLEPIRRWRWLILSLVAVTFVALVIRVVIVDPAYVTTMRLQFTTPQDNQDVALFDQYRSADLRGEILIAQNDFTTAMLSSEVYRRTSAQFGYDPLHPPYQVAIAPVLNTDYLDVTVHARSPQLAVDLANAQLQNGIAYYGELRAKPFTAQRDSISQLLATQELQVESSHWLASLPNMPVTYQTDASQADADYKLLQQKLSEATLKEDVMLHPTFIQVAAAPLKPLGPAIGSDAVLVGLGVLGSAMAGIWLAFMLDLVRGRRNRRHPALAVAGTSEVVADPEVIDDDETAAVAAFSGDSRPATVVFETDPTHHNGHAPASSPLAVWLQNRPIVDDDEVAGE